VTVVGVIMQVRPVAGLTVEVSPTRPVKPCWAVTEIVDVFDCPTRALRVVGAASTVKSCTL
jgi:hypothetical protein